MAIESLEINGSQPTLTGQTCEEILCQEYWYRGELKNPANVIHLRCGGRWHRLYFDWGVVFWREDGDEPAGYCEWKEGDDEFRTVDIGKQLDLCGRVVESVVATPIEAGSQVAFRFEGGRRLVFSCENDVTKYAA
jgi:hypothetical protein